MSASATQGGHNEVESERVNENSFITARAMLALQALY